VDLAIGLFPGLKAGFYQQRLYGDRFVCIVREGHPLVGDSLSLEQYAALPHAVVVSTGTGHDTALEQSLVKQRVHRRIAVAVPHFLVLPAIVAETDAIATVPFRMAAAMQGQARIRVLEAPLSFPRIEVRHYWHERYHKDAASTWLRALVARLLKE
jgi:DNA-binding transcriptional LysR family regulator